MLIFALPTSEVIRCTFLVRFLVPFLTSFLNPVALTILPRTTTVLRRWLQTRCLRGDTEQHPNPLWVLPRFGVAALGWTALLPRHLTYLLKGASVIPLNLPIWIRTHLGKTLVGRREMTILCLCAPICRQLFARILMKRPRLRQTQLALTLTLKQRTSTEQIPPTPLHFLLTETRLATVPVMLQRTCLKQRSLCAPRTLMRTTLFPSPKVPTLMWPNPLLVSLRPFLSLRTLMTPTLLPSTMARKLLSILKPVPRCNRCPTV